MPLLENMRETVEELAIAFEELKAWSTIYLVPEIKARTGASVLELQIADNGSQVVDHDGGFRREDFELNVGIMLIHELDSDEMHTAALSHLTESLYVYQQRIINRLDGNFLNRREELLTRPLIYLGTSKTRTESETTIKIISFIGGLNADWRSG